MSDSDNAFARLGIPAEASEKDIKRAYARLLKQIDQASEPDAFARLRLAYETALASVKFRLQCDAPGKDVSSDAAAFSDSERPEEGAPGEGRTPDVGSNPSQQLTIEQRVAQLIDQLAIAVVRDGAGDPEACEAHLRALLAGDALMSLATRDTFEGALVHALARRRFGNASGAMLVAAADVYMWRLGQLNVLRQCGEEGRYIERLLDEEAWMRTGDTHAWLHLDDTEALDAAPELVAQCEHFRRTCPQLFEFCYPEGLSNHRERGADTNSWSFRLMARWARFKLEHPIGYTFAAVIWLPIVIGVILLCVSQLSKNQPLREVSACTTLYGDMARRDWRNISMLEVDALQRCGEQQAPALCSDRDQLLSVLAESQRLLPNRYDYFLLAGGGDLVLRSASGLDYEVKASASCDRVFRLVGGSNWMGFGDDRAATELVRRAATCQSQSPTQEQKNLLIWLKQLKVWPGASAVQQKSGITLERLAQSDVVVKAEPMLDPLRSWPTCLPDPVVP